MKKKLLISILILSFSISLSSQHYYEGVIDTLAVKMLLYPGEGYPKGFYLYEKYNTPILLSTKGESINGKYVRFPNTLCELTKEGGHHAEINFDSLNNGQRILKGEWGKLGEQSTLRVVLIKKEKPSPPFILPTSISTSQHYFLAKYQDKRTELLIYDKQSNDQIQRIDSVNCSYRKTVMEVEDYNFDGIEDFSIHRSYAAGSNTFRDYFLWDPNKNEYFKSKIDGSSLSFDQRNELIYEHNQCCAGRSHMNATYKLVNNEMIEISRNCFEMDKNGDIINDKCD